VDGPDLHALDREWVELHQLRMSPEPEPDHEAEELLRRHLDGNAVVLPARDRFLTDTEPSGDAVAVAKSCRNAAPTKLVNLRNVQCNANIDAALKEDCKDSVNNERKQIEAAVDASTETAKDFCEGGRCHRVRVQVPQLRPRQPSDRGRSRQPEGERCSGLYPAAQLTMRSSVGAGTLAKRAGGGQGAAYGARGSVQDGWEIAS
jgi:hypothetical protein